MGEFAPFVWQSAQTVAFAVLVFVWVYVPVTQEVGWGAAPP
jgi:heme exporter protein D